MKIDYNKRMSKRLILKCTLVAFIICTSLIISNFAYIGIANAEVQGNEKFINQNTIYQYIDRPTKIIGDKNNFFVIDSKGKLFSFSNKLLIDTGISFENLVDITFVTEYNKLYAIDNDNLLEIDTQNYTLTITNPIINGTSIYCDAIYNIISTENKITISAESNSISLTNYYTNNYSQNNFSNIKDICVFNNTIYILDANEMTSQVNLISIKIESDITNCKAVQVKQISVNTKNDFEINAISNGLLIRESNSLKLYNFEGNATSSLLKDYSNFERSFKSGEIVNCSSFIASDNTIIIADKFSNCIQSFNLINDNLVFEKLLIASFGSDIDRLYKPTSLTTISEDAIIISDYGNKRLIYNSLATNEIISLQFNESPSLVTSCNNKEIYVYAMPNLYCFKSFSDESPIIYDLSAYSIIDMQVSNSNELYLLDSVSKSVLKFNNSSTLETINTFTTLNEQSKINIDASGKIAYISTDKDIYALTFDNNEISTIISCDYEIIDFASDYKSNLYILTKNTDNNLQITKYKDNNEIATKTLIGTNYINLEINLNTGKFYAIDEILSTVKEIYFDNFTDNLISFNNDLSFIDSPTNTNGACIGKITTHTNAYKYPFMISPIMEIEENCLIIVIDKQCDANEKFSYCLIANKSNVNILAYIPNDCIDFDITDKAPAFSNIKVITAYAYLYKLPTSLNFENGQNLQLSNIAYQNDLFEVVGYASNYKDFSGNSYYCIKLEDGTFAYMKTFNAMNSTLDVYQDTFQPNAH
ncbi:MAG: hypothetical protein ACI4TX_04835, partial [Christensenellales bacterium]